MPERKMVLLLSGGIDSPVAGYLLGRQGVEITALSGLVNPEGDRVHTDKMLELAKVISRSIHGDIDLYLFEQRIAQSIFSASGKSGLTCVLCKRMMLRVAERLCRQIGASAIIMGDSLGQVASQTLQNIRVIEQAVSIPIVRPLVGLDKVEIVKTAEQIGTFEISNSESPGCIFVPSRPATKARLEEVLKEEERLGIAGIFEKTAGTLHRSGGLPQ
jgi:thiamine biosynthesis protein ThiI